MTEPNFTRLVNIQRASYTPPRFLRITYPSTPIDLYPSSASKFHDCCSEVVNGDQVVREKPDTEALRKFEATPRPPYNQPGKRTEHIPAFLRRQAE
jgi:hypothetical protein